MRTSSASSAEFRFARPDGLTTHLVGQCRPQLHADGTITGFVGTITDVTSLKHAEAHRKTVEMHLRHTQKMESLGTLAGGIAHDFNNILTGVFGFVELAQLQIPAGHDAQQLLKQTLRAAQRAKELVGQILTFSRRNEGERRPVQLGTVATEALRLLRSSLPAEVDLRWQFDPASPLVFADPTQIHQIVMNLCTNAWHALPACGGRITLTLAEAEISASLAQAYPESVPGPAVRLTVADNGSGMEGEILGRIFEPFFTTKAPGTGTGLGLAVVHGIVTSHRGVVAVRSAPGEGTTFDLYFPALQGAPALLAASSLEADVPLGRGEHVLWVDDDSVSRAAIQQSLRSFGYRVTAFDRPERAIRAFRVAPNEFALVLADLSMPGISGDEVATQVLRLNPAVPVVVLSGMAEPARQSALIRSGVREVLLKPTSRAELACALRRQLAPRQVS